MKKKIIIILSIILIIGITTICIIKYNKYKENQKIINEIKNSYSEIIMTNKDKDIFIKDKDNYKKIGKVYKDTIISLKEKEIKDKNDIYYQIKDTNYYIDYKNIKEETSFKENNSLDKYLVTKTIKTTKTNLYQEDNLKIQLDKNLEFDLLMKEKDKYYVKYLNNIYYIKDNYELIDKKIDIKPLTDISVLNINENITTEKLEEVLKHLQDNNYKTITIDDFKLWVNENINLENNKVLLISNKELDNKLQEIVNKYNYTINIDLKDIKFVSGDSKIKVNDTKYYKYDISKTTTINRVKDMLKGIKEVKPVAEQKIAVLNYHFFYDSSIGEKCNESICLDISNFRKQLDYLKNNGYKTLTMKEFNDWMDKKITLPKKSVLITIDDGAMGTSKINGNKLIPILEEYQMHATLFLITGWWNIENYRSEYLEVHSHGNELHHGNYCKNGKCGAKGTLLSKEELVDDLKTSISKIDNNNLSFCYPFYAYNNTMISALKETGFKLAFIGGNKKASRSNNKYLVPRYVIYKNTSLNSFINMIS